MSRARLLFIVYTLVFIALIGRLFYWQIVKGKELTDVANGQYQRGKVLSAPRGNILASDGSYLAARADSWLIYASPKEITVSTKELANKLDPLLTIDTALLLSNKSSVWLPLKSSVPTEKKDEIEKLDIAGIGFERQETRVYPEASSSAHILGFLGKDNDGNNKGYSGLEGYYDLVLSGKPGYKSRDTDVAGNPILSGFSKEVGSEAGVDLLTGIDKGVQFSVEENLARGVEKYGAKGGTVIVMEPKTGQVIAMASYPSYDPKKYFDYGNEYFKNPSISDAFEPGSIFKVLVMAAGLDAGVVTPDTKCDVCGGPYRVDKYIIETWNRKYNPDSTMTDVIVNSDNVGMSFVSAKLGSDKLYEYLEKFGIGTRTGIDLQGEVAVPMRKKGTWNIVDLATASFGQGIAVTPMQMIRAVSAIANDGKLVTPHVVSKIKSGEWEEDGKKTTTEMVLSHDSAEKITAMMAEAARRGESKWTSVRGYSVAGKTGTAQIPIAGHYDEKRTNASFVGFAPIADPKFVMLVILNEPASSQWASETAAPLWYSIAKDLFWRFGIQPEN